MKRRLYTPMTKSALASADDVLKNTKAKKMIEQQMSFNQKYLHRAITERWHPLVLKTHDCHYCGILIVRLRDLFRCRRVSKIEGRRVWWLERDGTSRVADVATQDHLAPRSRGGMDTNDNIVWSCNSCNEDKADLTETEYKKKKEENVDYEEAKDLCARHGWNLDCWSPLEVSQEDGTFAAGFAAELVLDELRLEDAAVTKEVA